MRRLARFAWAVVAYNLAVIGWGAYVRATGSGAGCGAHWPLCNGEIVPRAPSVEMLVEFSHRVSSGLALVAVLALGAWTWRALPAGHVGRKSAAGAVVFILTEAAVGAALVLFRLVADNETMARAMMMSVHLLNTFVLLAFLVLTAYWVSGGQRVRVRGSGATPAWLLAGAAGVMLIGVSGGVAALGDTLQPASSLGAGFAADLSPASHLLLRLRVIHPAAAVTVGCALLAVALGLRRSGHARTAASAVAACVALQMTAGIVNLLRLAPVWMQIVHLLLADLLWMAYVLMAAQLLAPAVLRVREVPFVHDHPSGVL